MMSQTWVSAMHVRAGGGDQSLTLSVDFVLQQLHHGLLLGDVQWRLAFAVHHAHVGALADQIPVVEEGKQD